jgi:hypothetical protein
MKGKYENLMLAFDVFVFGLVAGKMSMQWTSVNVVLSCLHDIVNVVLQHKHVCKQCTTVKLMVSMFTFEISVNICDANRTA